MKIFEKFTKKFTEKASTAVKSEVKKTALDLLPTVLSVVGMIFGVAIFKEVVDEPDDDGPVITNTTITTNNYFFNSLSEESINKILEDQKK